MPRQPGLALAALSACLAVMVGGAHADWSKRAASTATPLRPANGGSVAQANPDFSWPLAVGASRYLLEVKDAQGRTRLEAQTSDNRHTPRQPLPTGTYRWRVTAVAAAAVELTDWQSFVVPTSAQAFPIPDWSASFTAARLRTHPRSVPVGAGTAALGRVVAEERLDGWRRLAARVKVRLGQAAAKEPSRFAGGDSRQYHQWMFGLPKQLQTDFQQIDEASLLWLIERDPDALADAKRRVLALAALDPEGATAYEPTHHPARNLLWALTIGYDRLHDQFDSTEREHLVRMIDRRFTQIERSIAGPKRALESMPFDSHGWVALHSLAAVASVMAGELSNSAARYERFLTWVLNWPCPWGDEDGGFGNGTAYASWDLEGMIPYWDAIQHSSGIVIYLKPWLRNLGRFFAYFAPPGTPTHLFGDGAERRVAHYVTWALAARVRTPENDWLLNKAVPEDPSSTIVLTAPSTSARTKPVAVPGPRSLFLPSIGWVAMHSELGDGPRTSVYFKASPYGSISHSHADQNSFVIDAGGRRLLIDGGRYDWYGSPHRKLWYETTQAHNAITYDGGKGQGTADRAAAGHITHYGDDGVAVHATGDATAAYGGHLRRATRTIILVRPSTILVVDRLRADKPHAWEWRMHSSFPFVAMADGRTATGSDGATACVRTIHGPSAGLHSSTEWPAPPEGLGDAAPQWHASFSSAPGLLDVTWVHWISLGCDPATPSTTANDGGIWIHLPDTDLLIDDSGAVVRRSRTNG